MDFDLELAKSQSNENPVYYVQYAHARICSLLKMAATVVSGESAVGSGSAAPMPASAGAAATGAASAVDGVAGDGVGAAGMAAMVPTPATAAASAPASAAAWPGAGLHLLTHPAELELIRKLADLPEEISRAALDREPHHLPRYAMELAALYHSFYDKCHCLVDDIPLRQARLQLSDATRIVLRNVLEIIGVNAPDRM
jgi:arginyl-tRNA synthetase